LRYWLGRGAQWKGRSQAHHENLSKSKLSDKFRSMGKYSLVVAGSLLVGVAIFVASFYVMDFVWTHFVVTDLRELTPADGVVVIGGGFVLGTTLGLAGLALMLYRFWPRKRISK
jgi:uncharacterized membrane protein YgdD (TMEM256/DUF423 family)